MRLVEQEQLWLQHDLASELDPPLHSMRCLPRQAIGRHAETDCFQRSTRLLDRDPGDPGGEIEIRGKTQLWIQRRGVPNQAETGTDIKPIM